MAWREVDVEKRLWTIPGSRMKADAPHVVPLSPAVIAILESLPRWTGDYVFSGKDGKRPISWFSMIKDRVDLLMPGSQIGGFTTCGARCGQGFRRYGYRILSLSFVSGTRKRACTKRMINMPISTRNAPFDAWVARLLSIVDPGDADNVVSFSKNRG